MQKVNKTSLQRNLVLPCFIICLCDKYTKTMLKMWVSEIETWRLLRLAAQLSLRTRLQSVSSSRLVALCVPWVGERLLGRPVEMAVGGEIEQLPLKLTHPLLLPPLVKK